jgi:hypothetical protein
LVPFDFPIMEQCLDCLLLKLLNAVVHFNVLSERFSLCTCLATFCRPVLFCLTPFHHAYFAITGHQHWTVCNLQQSFYPTWFALISQAFPRNQFWCKGIVIGQTFFQFRHRNLM